MVVENIKNFWLIFAYGCANGLGDIFTIRSDTYIERIENNILRFLGGIRLHWPIEFIRKRKTKKAKKRRQPKDKR
jgi:hypothetical protein